MPPARAVRRRPAPTRARTRRAAGRSAPVTIGDAATPMPHSVGFDQTLATAHELMRTHLIRHLPVLRGGKLVGIVTERDLHLVETLKGIDPGQVPVEDAMTPDVYAVTPRTALAKVATAMARRKLGCAVVMRGEKVVGIFTTIDGMRVLAERLGGR